MSDRADLSKRGWEEFKLGEVAEFGNGKARPKTEGEIPVYGGNGILGYCDQFNYNNETIIIGRVGAYCGSVYYENKPVWISDNALSVKPKGMNNTKFLFYFLKNLDLNQLAEGSSHPLVTQTLLNSIDVIVTDDESEQRAIAGVLSSLDDKIDLLHRQNKTLESLAETLWRYYFDDNRQKNWEECLVGDISNHEKQSIHPRKALDTFFYHYSIPAFDESKMPSMELGAFIQSNKYRVSGNTILFSKLNPHKDKRLWLIPENISPNSVCSTEFQILRPKLITQLFFLYGFLNHPDNYDKIAAGVGGTSGSHQRINPEAIFKSTCFLPPDNTLNCYNAQVEPIFKKIRCNREQTQILILQRDTLLPKLMSGEVKVKTHA